MGGEALQRMEIFAQIDVAFGLVDVADVADMGNQADADETRIVGRLRRQRRRISRNRRQRQLAFFDYAYALVKGDGARAVAIGAQKGVLDVLDRQSRVGNVKVEPGLETGGRQRWPTTRCRPSRLIGSPTA